MAHGVSRGKDCYFVSIKGLKKDSAEEVHFLLKKRDKTEKSNFIEGYLTKAEVEEYEWEGKMKKAFKLTFVDGEDEYILSSGFTMMGRTIVNTLASIEKFTKKLKFQVYVNNNGFNSIFITNDGEKIAWKHSWDEQKKLIKPRKDADTGEILGNNYTKLNELLEGDVWEIDKRISTKEDISFEDDDDLDTIFKKVDAIEAAKNNL